MSAYKSYMVWVDSLDVRCLAVLFVTYAAWLPCFKSYLANKTSEYSLDNKALFLEKLRDYLGTEYSDGSIVRLMTLVGTTETITAINTNPHILKANRDDFKDAEALIAPASAR